MYELDVVVVRCSEVQVGSQHFDPRGEVPGFARFLTGSCTASGFCEHFGSKLWCCYIYAAAIPCYIWIFGIRTHLLPAMEKAYILFRRAEKCP